MKYVLTDIKGVINEIMKENNITITELSHVLNMNEFKLKQKLSNTNDQNKFTLLQLEQMAQYFGYDLHIDFVKGKDIKHCQSVHEKIVETKQKMAFLSIDDNK